MAGNNDGYEYSTNPVGDGWEFHGVLISGDKGMNEYRRAIKKPNNYPQPGTIANAPGIYFPKTAFYQGGQPQQPTTPTPGLPQLTAWDKGIHGLKKYVEGISPGEMRSESAAILAELGDIGSGRVVSGGPGAYARRDQLKAAIELLKDRVNKENIDPNSVPELRDYARKQLVDNGGAAAAVAASAAGKVFGGYIKKRLMGKPKPCAC